MCLGLLETIPISEDEKWWKYISVYKDTYRWSHIFLYSIRMRWPLQKAWNWEMIFDRRSSRISSSSPTIPALKNTLVLPIRYSDWSSCMASINFSAATLPSTKPDGMAEAAKIWYLDNGKGRRIKWFEIIKLLLFIKKLIKRGVVFFSMLRSI